MKRLSFSLTVISLIITFLLGFSVPQSTWAAKKRIVDQLKYPDLNPLKLPEVRESETTNGIKLRLIKDEKLPLVTVRIILKGGNAYDPLAKVGLSDITAQLLRIGGTKEMTGDQLDKFLDDNGISIAIFADTEFYRISLDCLKENLDNALGILAKMLLEPAFDPEKLEEIKTQLSSTIARRNDTPNSILEREFNKLIYGDRSPLAAVLEYAHLENISRQDLMMTHLRFFAPGNMLVGVVGPLEPTELTPLFEKHFGQWNHQARIPPFPEVKEHTPDFKVAFIEKSNLNQSYFSIGHLGIKESLAEKAKIRVFNTIFSSGMDSRLNLKIRVKMGLTYGAGGGILAEHLYPGTTYFSTFTKSESTLKAIKAVFAEIDLIRREKVGKDELEKAKDYLLNSYVFNYSTPARIMSRYLEDEFYGIPADADKKMLEDIKKTTSEDVLEVAQKYLHPDKMVVCVVGNEEKTKEGGDLAELGTIKKIDISIPAPPLQEKIPAPTAEMLKKGGEIVTSLFKTTYKGYSQLKSLEVQQEAKMTVAGRDIDMKSKTLIRYPDSSYSDISLMGGMMKVERIINGKKGLTKQMNQQIPMTAEDIEKEKFGDIYDIFSSLETGKYRFQYLKEEKIDGKTYDVIYIFDAQKNWVKFFINRETRWIEIEERVSRIPGQSGVARTVKSDFKTEKGVPIAFKAETYIKDKKVMEMTVTGLKVNPPVDPALFKIEEKK
jgi:zinc protease